MQSALGPAGCPELPRALPGPPRSARRRRRRRQAFPAPCPGRRMGRRISAGRRPAKRQVGSNCPGPPPESAPETGCQTAERQRQHSGSDRERMRRAQASTAGGGGGGVRRRQVQRPRLPARSGAGPAATLPVARWCRSGAAGRCCRLSGSNVSPSPPESPAQRCWEETPEGASFHQEHCSPRQQRCICGVSAWRKVVGSRAGPTAAGNRRRPRTTLRLRNSRSRLRHQETPRTGYGRWNRRNARYQARSVELALFCGMLETAGKRQGRAGTACRGQADGLSPRPAAAQDHHESKTDGIGGATAAARRTANGAHCGTAGSRASAGPGATATVSSFARDRADKSNIDSRSSAAPAMHRG